MPGWHPQILFPITHEIQSHRKTIDAFWIPAEYMREWRFSIVYCYQIHGNNLSQRSAWHLKESVIPAKAGIQVVDPDNHSCGWKLLVIGNFIWGWKNTGNIKILHPQSKFVGAIQTSSWLPLKHRHFNSCRKTHNFQCSIPTIKWNFPFQRVADFESRMFEREYKIS